MSSPGNAPDRNAAARWARGLRRREPRAPEADAGGGPYVWAQQVHDGTLSERRFLRAVAAYDFMPTDSGPEDTVQFVPGSWDEMTEAVGDGLITSDLYGLALQARQTHEKATDERLRTAAERALATSSGGHVAPSLRARAAEPTLRDTGRRRRRGRRDPSNNREQS